MNQVTKEQKEMTTKWLAIIGFVSMVVLIVFVVVKLVSFLPSAWSSLASIADSVYNYDRNPSLTVTTKNSVMNAGEAFTVNWKEQKNRGSFEFSYTCTDGASIDVRNFEGDIEPLDCDKVLKLGTATALDLVVHTEKQRFTDVVFTVRFIPSDPRLESLSTESRVTIVNVRIPTTGVTETDTPSETAATPVETPTPEPTPATSTVPKTPTYVTNITYSVPQSNPNGFTDLQVTYLGVGTLQGDVFTPHATLDRNENGAIRFAVKNIGTKTSDDWHYTANLPSDVTYTSRDQVALKPNEEAIITISFLGADRVGTERFGVSIDVTGDINAKNDSFTWAVEVK